MIVFWLICAVMVAIALAFILPTLLERPPKDTEEKDRKEANLDIFRDQLSELEADLRNGIIGKEQYQQDRDEIERRLLDDDSTLNQGSKKTPQRAVSRAAIYAIALGIPVIAVALYLLLGNSAALSGAATNIQAAPARGPAGAGQMSQQQIETNVAELAKRMEQNPGDSEGWVMLARSYMTLERYGDASNAYLKAAKLKPNDADLLADLAFALAMANDRKLEGEPFELLTKALRLDPENERALELAGSAEFQAKNYKQAIDYWQKALAKIPAGSELATTISQNINQAKALSGASSK